MTDTVGAARTVDAGAPGGTAGAGGTGGLGGLAGPGGPAGPGGLGGPAMRVVVVGGGKVGSFVAKLLVGQGCDVTVVERDEDAGAGLGGDASPSSVLVGSGTDLEVLERAGGRSADVVCAVTGADETNLMVATIAKFGFGVARVLARVNDPRNRWLFDATTGVDVPVNQAEMMAQLVVREIDRPS